VSERGVVLCCVDVPPPTTTLTLSHSPPPVFFPDVIQDVNYLEIMKSVVPEIVDYNETLGFPFRSTKFPSLRYCVHTGFDIEDGLTNYKHIMAFNGEPKDRSKETDPVFFDISSDGKVGKTMNHKEAVEHEGWTTVNAILSKQYSECNNQYNDDGL